VKRCHECKTPWASEKKVPGPKEFCEGCGAYLHCCLNCRHYDPSRHNQCFIPTADWVGDKSGPNFCDEFEFGDDEAAPAEKQEDRSALDALFGDAAGDADRPQTGRDALDKLFGEQ
jgi:hypothetical protein